MRKITIALLTVSFFSSFVFADELLDSIKKKKTISQKKTLQTLESKVVREVSKMIRPIKSDQNIFFDFLKREKYRKALVEWPTAFENHSFSRTSTGRALHAYLLFKNGLEVLGVKKLLKIKNPRNIRASVRQLWKKTATYDHQVWKLAHTFAWTQPWLVVFGKDIHLKVRTQRIRNSKHLSKITPLLKIAKKHTEEYNDLLWKSALGHIVNGQIKTGKRQLAAFLKREKNPEKLNLAYLTGGRVFFQQGFLRPAEAFYKKVSKDSSYWFPAQEELAWVYMRLGGNKNYAKALSLLESFNYPAFAFKFGPDPVFLRSLAYLKVCDYKKTFENVIEFKQLFKPRLEALVSLQKGVPQNTVDLLANAFDKGRIQWGKLGEFAIKFPRYSLMDEVLNKRVQLYKRLQWEKNRADKLYLTSLEGGAQVGFQGELAELKEELNTRMKAEKGKINALIKARGKQELASYKKIINKMHVIETEAIQQISLLMKKRGKVLNIKPTKKMATKKSPYDLEFSFTGERWADEIGNFQVKVAKDSCLKKTGTF